MNVGNQFLLYQVHRIKGLWQSSASSMITGKPVMMLLLSQVGISAVRNFWQLVPKDPSALDQIQSQTLSTSALFHEAIEKWPNNCHLCEEYSMFLVEGAMDFAEGMKVKHRAELIEQGKNFVINISFRSLVHDYPQYLKLGIMDCRGNFIKKETPCSDGSTSSSGSDSRDSQLSTGTMDGQLGAEIEEELG
jgi:hypothetical protein